MKATLFSFLVSVIFALHGNVFAQSPDQKESQIKLQRAAVQRLRTKLAQQQSQISELKQELVERDKELHSLLKLISNQSTQPAQPDAQPPGNSPSNNSDNDDDDDSDDSCNGPLFARGRSIPNNSGTVSRHHGHLRLDSAFTRQSHHQ